MTPYETGLLLVEAVRMPLWKHYVFIYGLPLIFIILGVVIVIMLIKVNPEIAKKEVKTQ